MNNSSQGLALAIVLVLMILVSLAGSGMLILANSHYKLTQHLIDSTHAFYLAEAGLQRGVFLMTNQGTPFNETFVFEGTSIDIEFYTTDNETFDITAVTQAASSPGGVVRRIQARVRRDSDETPASIIGVDMWQES